jgi:hypothetical protein
MIAAMAEQTAIIKSVRFFYFSLLTLFSAERE